MPSGSWHSYSAAGRYFTFVLVAAFIGAATAHGQGTGDKAGADEFALPVRIIEDPSETKIAEDQQARTEEVNRRNLYAQDRAADAAAKSADHASTQTAYILWQTIIALISTGAILYTLHLNRRSIRLTQDLINDSRDPYVYISYSGPPLTLTENGFASSSGEPSWPLFDIQNSTKTAVIITGICRRWDTCHPSRLPPPIDWRNPPGDTKFKKNFLPIAADGKFTSVGGGIGKNTDIFRNIDDKRLYFYGFIEYKNISGDEFISGFCLVYGNGIFYAAWPHKTPCKYNYRVKKSQPESGKFM